MACPLGDPEDIIVIELTEPLPPPFNATNDGEAWFLVLEDGQECGRFTGTLPPRHVSGLEPNGIGCSLGVGYGVIDTNGPAWTIQIAENENGKVITERVRSAYR